MFGKLRRKARNITLRDEEEAIQIFPPLPTSPFLGFYLHRTKVLPLSEVPTFDHHTNWTYGKKLSLGFFLSNYSD